LLMFREEKQYFNRYKAGNEALNLLQFIFSSTLNLIFLLINRVFLMANLTHNSF
jgi:hypothetical protein